MYVMLRIIDPYCRIFMNQSQSRKQPTILYQSIIPAFYTN
jgi:hypothetical protein